MPTLSRSTAPPLAGRVALVAGATRGAGRGIAVALGEAGATVYCSGRSTRGTPSPLARPETIEETADLVSAAGGVGIAVRTDHTERADIAALMARIHDGHGGLDLLVNDVWGGDAAGDWLWAPLADTDVDAGWALMRQAVYSHLLTGQLALPLLRGRERALVVEVTDGDTMSYRGAIFYDLIKTTIMRLAFALSVELRPEGIAAVAITPGFLRSEAMLDLFEVTESTWRDGVSRDPHFAASESPTLVGRAVAALAAERDILAMSGETFSSWELARRYGLHDADGSRPDWLAHFRRHIPADHPARAWMRAGLSWQDSIRRRTRGFLKVR
ncbi:MAG: SDR family NAD(P)-dependent oxidoreductase [Gemmatimonadetes bacterium]|nr:SDR family NAD(P)-dependent oxidoreductase [Gemmatimonadota bacterium]MCC6774013.1 SDR family NAD(P)-dependent oxidoreductase [Gemmatimonadaceae bacterium]